MPRFSSPGGEIPQTVIDEWNAEADLMRGEAFGALDVAAQAAVAVKRRLISESEHGTDVPQSLLPG